MEPILDIVTGLISAAVGACLAFLWTQFLYPLWVEFHGERTKLHEEYKGRIDFGNGPTHEISLRIKKLGYRIDGSLRFTEGSNQGQNYTVVGRYSQGFLAFTYSPANPERISQGSATFKRIKDGDELEGAFSYYHRETDKVSTVLCKLTKA